MPKRKDGEKTRGRILEAACELFGKKGFRDATVAEICKRAQVNIAAVNYYFRDKESLYLETWRYAHSKVDTSASRNDVLQFSGSPEKRLRMFILHLATLFGDEERSGEFHRLQMMEIVNPTGLIDEEFQKMREPLQNYVHQAIRELLGESATDEEVLLCEMSIVSQCRSVFARSRCHLDCYKGKTLTGELLEEVAGHITNFSLGGIRATRESRLVSACSRASAAV